MNLKKIIIIIISILILCIIGIFCYFKFRFKLEVTLSNNRNVAFGNEINLKDFIIYSNGIFLDKKVKFYELGEKEVTISYLNKYNKEKEYKFNINIVDETSPIIIASSSVTGYVGDEVNLLKNVICADYESNNVSCIVEGEYDKNTLGNYKLKYVATDESGNSISKDFTYYVIEKTKKTNNTSSTSNTTYTPFKKIYDEHKTSDTLIGIDVSKWQGNIDFNKVKEAGAEFVIIRMGVYYNNEVGLDLKFEENIKKAYEAGLKIGLYFYSEARTMDEITESVDFIVENIKYPLDLPIAYDWEDFYNYNSYKLSLYEFNNLAYAFMDKLKEKGYETMLYGSKNYLTYLWDAADYPVWVAQYYKEVTYTGNYKMWQLTNNATIDGIYGAVDVDILYLNK